MRSEKRMSSKKEMKAKKYTEIEMARYMRDLYIDKDCYEYEILTKAIKLFEKEPRYSVWELQRILISDEFLSTEGRPEAVRDGEEADFLLEWIGLNPKEVKEILEGKE